MRTSGVARGRNLSISTATAPILVTIDDDAPGFRDADALRKITAAFSNNFMQSNRAGVLLLQGALRQTQQMR